MKKTTAILSPLFAVLTCVISLWVAYLANENPFSTVSSTDLLRWGAVDKNTLYSGEVWRLLTAQFMHSKQLHMFASVLLGLALGNQVHSQMDSNRKRKHYSASARFGYIRSSLSKARTCRRIDMWIPNP